MAPGSLAPSMITEAVVLCLWFTMANACSLCLKKAVCQVDYNEVKTSILSLKEGKGGGAKIPP
jgi:hypothetical protein